MKKLIIAAVVAAAVGGVAYANYAATQEVKKVVDKQISALSIQSGVEIKYSDILLHCLLIVEQWLRECN